MSSRSGLLFSWRTARRSSAPQPLMARSISNNASRRLTASVYPQTVVQTCIVHLIRNSLAFVAWKDRKAILPAIKAIYRAENADMALVRLEEFEDEWGKRYPAIGQAWRRAWEQVVPFFAFAPGVRKMIYTTNAVEA